MSGWIKHWKALPTRNRVGVAVSLAAFLVTVFALVIQIQKLAEARDDVAPTTIRARGRAS